MIFLFCFSISLTLIAIAIEVFLIAVLRFHMQQIGTNDTYYSLNKAPTGIKEKIYKSYLNPLKTLLYLWLGTAGVIYGLIALCILLHSLL